MFVFLFGKYPFSLFDIREKRNSITICIKFFASIGLFFPEGFGDPLEFVEAAGGAVVPDNALSIAIIEAISGSIFLKKRVTEAAHSPKFAQCLM